MIESTDFELAPDGGAAYAVSGFSGAVMAFTRDASSGRLIQPRAGGCLRWTGWAGHHDHCTNALPVLNRPSRVVVGEDIVLVSGLTGVRVDPFRLAGVIVGLRRNHGDGSLEPVPGMCLATVPVPAGCQELPAGLEVRSASEQAMTLSEDGRTL